MDYKEKYENAIGRAKAAHGTGAYDDATMEFLFPELLESEDERIRKELIEFIQWSEDRGMTRHDFHQAKRPSEWIAYLEKQKAKERLDRMAPIYNDKESFESALEKAWKYYNESASRTVDSFEDDYIECVFSKGFREGFLYREKQKEQKPAEHKAFEKWVEDYWSHNKVNNPYNKGDEVQFDHKGFVSFCEAYCYPQNLVLHDTFGYEEGRQTGQNEGVKLVLNNPEKYGLQKEQKPAEWSEVELEFRGEKVKVKRPFFRDDKGRGYSTTEQDDDVAWYALRAWCEKKRVSLYDLYPREEWNEADEAYLQDALWCVEKAEKSCKDKEDKVACWSAKRWLITLSERFILQSKQEWSEEDETRLTNILIMLKEYVIHHYSKDDVNKSVDWLENRVKFLRPQSEQMISEDTEVLMAKLVNLLKSYRIGEETATTLANRIADTYGTQRYMDGLCDSGNLHWKPSEEQMDEMEFVINDYREDGCNRVADCLQEVLEQMKKL